MYNIEWEALKSAFTMVGYQILIVFSAALLWISCNALCLSVLVNHKVPFFYLLYTQITGDAYNSITPFGGLGGVPVKINNLTKYLNIHQASETIIRDQLIHSTSGIMFTAFLSFLAIGILPYEEPYIFPLLATGVVFLILSILFVVLIFSSKPGKLLQKLLTKIKILSDYRSNPIKRITFLKALGFKMLGRLLSMLELFIIFMLLGFAPSFLDILTVMTVLTIGSSILFIFPQGIGVHEAGITGAFSILGYSATMGLSFGLIRRARSLFWMIFGIALHLLVVLFYKKNLPTAVNTNKTSLAKNKS